MNTLNEIEVLKEYLKGSQKAFKTLYDSYQGYVYTICIRYGVQQIDVKDMMQTIFMEVFRSLSNYDASKAQFKTWLSRVTVNQILAQKRKKKIDYLSLGNEDCNLIEAEFSFPEESIMSSKMMSEILNRMPAKYVSVFNLFIIDGYTHNEISEILSITVVASRTLLHRGRAWAMKEIKSVLKESNYSRNIKRQ